MALGEQFGRDAWEPWSQKRCHVAKRILGRIALDWGGGEERTFVKEKEAESVVGFGTDFGGGKTESAPW